MKDKSKQPKFKQRCYHCGKSFYCCARVGVFNSVFVEKEKG